MGITEYAAHRGCELYAVQHAIARGRITLNPDNRIDSEAADREWRDNTAEQGPQPVRDRAPRNGDRQMATKAEPGIPYTDARALREVVDVKRKELEYELRRGLLMRKEEVEKEAFRLFRRLRDAVFNLPPRLAAQLAAESDEHRCFELLERELRNVFTDFAEGRPA